MDEIEKNTEAIKTKLLQVAQYHAGRAYTLRQVAEGNGRKFQRKIARRNSKRHHEWATILRTLVDAFYNDDE